MLIDYLRAFRINYHDCNQDNHDTITKSLVFIILLIPAFNVLANTQDKKCLSCHSFKQLSTTFASGESLSLHVPAEVLEESVHHWAGCTNCHRDIDTENHMLSNNKKKYASKREHSIAMNKICHECHQDMANQYKGSIHASLAEADNAAAPLCTDCHGSHTVKPKATYETLTGVPCKNCHADIFDAYLSSMHGQARGQVGHIQAPICSDCHRAHDIKVASTEDRLKEACLGCHEDVKAAHGEWLPNAGLHLKAVSCPACHAPAAQRRVDLMLFDSIAQRPLSKGEVSSLGEAGEIGKEGLDSKALWQLVRGTNSNQDEVDVILRGRMKVTTGVQAHQMVWKDKALRDCETCHSHGAEPFSNVTVSLLNADGQQVSYSTEEGILNSPLSVDSIGDFYALGGTRIKILDIILLLVFVGGGTVVISHLAMRKLLKKNT